MGGNSPKKGDGEALIYPPIPMGPTPRIQGLAPEKPPFKKKGPPKKINPKGVLTLGMGPWKG